MAQKITKVQFCGREAPRWKLGRRVLLHWNQPTSCCRLNTDCS
jgi:hypothetical protein